MKSKALLDRVEEENADGVAADMTAGSMGPRGSLLTYKRRKTTKVVGNGTIWDDFMTKWKHKSEMHLSDENNQKSSYDPTSVSSFARSLKHQRDIVLEQICGSLESESVVAHCIQKAIAFHPGCSSRNTMKESIHSCDTESKCTFKNGSAGDDHHNALRSSGSINGLNHDNITEIYQRTFFDIVVSEHFAQLCCLLVENFQEMKVDKLLDLSYINSRINEKVYETSPALFHSDTQQIWIKLQKIGTDLTALAKCLSDRTTASFREQIPQVGSSGYSISDDGRHELITQGSEMHNNNNNSKGDVMEGGHSCCSHCGDKGDGRNILVCDSCEQMYHISCIVPAVIEIPSRSWYCANCTANGIESPAHVECVACDRLNGDGGEEAREEMEESSNGYPGCKVCTNVVRNDEDYRICGHSFCPNKFYHVRCLTNKQLISYGPCWYCPSCLCRGCFTDRDDDKIVLCDSCDHAYHIYCMNPPLDSIPQGNWFCNKCDSGIQKIRKAKLAYQKDNKSGERGGVDMLLNAATTLNFQDNLAAAAMDHLKN